MKTGAKRKSSYQIQKEQAAEGWRKYRVQLEENTRLKRTNAKLAMGRERLICKFGRETVEAAEKTHYRDEEKEQKHGHPSPEMRDKEQ